jgi:type VI secretion system secreted protein VgrG
MLDVFTIHSPALPKGTRVVGFRGSEGLSRLYAFEIHLTLSPDASDDFDLASATGAAASLVLDRRDGRPPFAFHGIFSAHALVHHLPDGRALLRAVLVPRLWRLTQTHHSRVFTQQALPDILKRILEDGGLTSDDYTLQLSQSYPPEEHVCQYRESDFDFISRWMEREGLYYWFEHGDAGEKLVIADSKAAHEDLAPAPVRFFALAGADHSARECLHTFVCRHRALPASVRYKDHDYTKPKLDVSGSAPVSKTGHGEISVHGARFFTPDAGKRLAQLRAEELLAREQVFTGSGTAFHLRAGYPFTLQDHPRGSFDARYLVTEVEHHGNQGASTPELRQFTGLAFDEVYRVDVTAIPHAVQFRAEQRTPWPRIYGTEHGVIDGEADSDYAQLDDQGRYTVRFAFDESDLGDGKASTRVRMMQPHGGDVEGWHFPLRKGTEVLFTFLGGDPDRPVIAGVVPNALTPSPINKANHTRNVIQTGGRNRFELEDKAGFERITLFTPYANTMIRMGSPNKDHELILRTDGAALLDTGKDWDVTVGGALKETVHKNVEENYKGYHLTNVSKGRSETVWAGGMIQQIVGGWMQEVKGDSSQTIKGHYTQTVTAGLTVNVTGGSDTNVTGDAHYTVKGSEVRIVTSDRTDVVSGSVMTNYGPWAGIFPSVNWAVSGEVTIAASDFDVNTPTHWETKGISKEATAMAIDFTGLLLETVGVHVESVSGHLETIGFHIENVGFHGGHEGIKLKQLAAEIKQAGATIKAAALHLFK